MSREVHVRFCERAGVSFPRATRPIVGFEHRHDAELFLRDLAGRLARFGLDLHPGKTRLIEFGRHAIARRRARGLGKPETFAFLGFTHYCATRRSGGDFVPGRTPRA
jgi:RNA-directed DNA polymerase